MEGRMKTYRLQFPAGTGEFPAGNLLGISQQILTRAPYPRIVTITCKLFANGEYVRASSNTATEVPYALISHERGGVTGGDNAEAYELGADEVTQFPIASQHELWAAARNAPGAAAVPPILHISIAAAPASIGADLNLLIDGIGRRFEQAISRLRGEQGKR